jgi:signal transduction histidine kinase/CheY-like chemotaxis protein
MDPGSYTLWVRMACLAGPPGPAISYSFRILPPWYHSPFAYVLGLFLAGSVIYLLVLLRTNKLRRRQRELEAAVQRRTNELQATAVALQQSAHAKTEFISTVSHELRNPLIGARMMAEVLFKAPIDPVAHGQVSKLRTCLSYLQTLLDGTLDLSRFQLGQVPYKLTRFQLGRLVGDTASMFEALAAEKGISYRIELGPWKEAWFCGESKHLQRVLVNFLSNAFKFTRKGEILLSVTVGQTSKTAFETLRFTVRDTGPGVAAAVQGQLFRAIVRQSDPLNQSGTPGTGLGLALSRKIAELSGASLGFENRPGEGATFWVEWPLLAASPEETDTTPGGRDFSRLRVLVVEDDPLQQEATALLLEELGVVAETAKSVDEAEKLMREIRFDLVLADYNLGGATGIDLIARCRLLPGSKGSSTRFHMLTSHLSEPVRRSALRAGFIGFHSKPLSLPTLYAMLAPPPSSVPSSAIHES